MDVLSGRMLQWRPSFLRLHNGREGSANELEERVSGFSEELFSCIDYLPGRSATLSRLPRTARPV
ncbi:hypothetical protein RvY_03596 [Ramazzottius varieornatus]|uniref:Uncharacterized protein n=1 Tax=Ramazzottius varieornatus TaxID=947166 RepID=A0A1D1UNL9_RAMVA|nr:hypothetical protein RvY_03596 [Ramazzottius varieornatus]